MKTWIKPLLAAIIMSAVSYGLYMLLLGIMPAKLATIIALATAVVVYVLAILVLKVFNKEDILMLPMGDKIYAILNKVGIYKEN